MSDSQVTFVFQKALVLLLISLSTVTPNSASSDELKPTLTRVQRIWDQAGHNAFTDLVRWRGTFYCAFREGQQHAGDRGKLRILVSPDGDTWQSTGLLAITGSDLRDAALSVTPGDQLMVLGGAQRQINGERETGTFVSFSGDGTSFSNPNIVIDPGRWLWRVTWHDDVAYGVTYGANHDRERSALLKSSDGIRFDVVTNRHLSQGDWPTEARIRFDSDGTCYSLHRRDGVENTACLGKSRPPYRDWDWIDLGVRLGGPNFLQLPNGRWVGAGRLYDHGARTSLFELDLQRGKLRELLRLPSGGDTSYPGLVWHDGILWVSYYSSHEQKTSIYLAQIRFDGLDEPHTPGTIIEIGNRLELFLDDHLVDQLNGAERRLHHPTAAENVIAFDQPWEGAFSGYVTVLRDGDKFRMYYRGLPKAGGDGSDQEVTCYAESHDGIQWAKPNLGIYKVHGTKQNNVVLQGQSPASHNFTPFLDTKPGVADDQRYKAVGGTEHGLIAFVSPDGLNWRRLQHEPVFTEGVFDSQNVPFYSVTEGKYVCYFRTWTQPDYRGFRTISRTTSDDFVHWTKPTPMRFGDTPSEHLYTNQTSPYFRAPHLLVGIAARFLPGRRVLNADDAKRIQVNEKYFGDVSDAVLLSSRGGDHYDRTFMESFIRPGLGLENWVSRTNYPALGIVPTGPNEASLYVQKNYGQPTSHLRRYAMRTDGFASIHAGYETGELITKRLMFGRPAGTNQNAAAFNRPPRESCQMFLNAATSAAGSLRVELQDDTGNPLSGFTLDDCDILIGDRINHVVSWHGETDISRWSRKPLRLRFELKDADLFSIQFR